MNNYNSLNIKTHHYPFGSVMPGRSYSSGDYRYGFNGKESDNEVAGNGNSYDYGFRIYNPRIGKFLSRDPLSKNYPHLTPYQFASNTPIQASDLDGLEAIQEIQYVYEGTSIATVTNYWLESNDERVQLILHDLGTGTTSEIWYSPVVIKYEPSAGEKFLAGVNDLNKYIANIPQKLEGLQSSMMGNSYGEGEGWVKSSGFEIKGEIGINKYSVSAGVSTFSNTENNIGIQGFLSFKVEGKVGVNSKGWTSTLTDFMPKAKASVGLWVNTETSSVPSAGVNMTNTTYTSGSASLGLFTTGINDRGKFNIGLTTPSKGSATGGLTNETKVSFSSETKTISN